MFDNRTNHQLRLWILIIKKQTQSATTTTGRIRVKEKSADHQENLKSGFICIVNATRLLIFEQGWGRGGGGGRGGEGGEGEEGDNYEVES